MTSPESTDSAIFLEREETAPPCCGRTFMVSGKIEHYKTPADATVAGGEDAAVFAEEVYGPSFMAVVPWLPEGRYTVDIDLAEVFHREVGSRIMDIGCGDTKLTEDLDILVAAGGLGKALRVTGEVEHESHAIRSLAGVRRISLRKGETRIVEIEIPKECLRAWDSRRKDYVVEAGDYEIEAGCSSEDIRARKTVAIER